MALTWNQLPPWLQTLIEAIAALVILFGIGVGVLLAFSAMSVPAIGIMWVLITLFGTYGANLIIIGGVGGGFALFMTSWLAWDLLRGKADGWRDVGTIAMLDVVIAAFIYIDLIKPYL